MNGAAFGSFADGLASGLGASSSLMSMAKMKRADKPDMSANPSGSTASGYSGDLSGFVPGKAGAAEAAAPAKQPESWGVLRSVYDGLSAGAQKVGNALVGGIGTAPAAGMKNNGLGGGIGQ